MSGTLGIATLDTTVDLGGLGRGLGAARAQTKSAFSGLQKAARLALAGIAVAAGMLAVKALTGVVTSAISVESAFAGVIKTTDGLADSTGALTEEGALLREGFRELSTEIPTDIEGLMGIGELGGQLGITRENLLGFTETMAAMGEATNLTSEAAASGFAQMANIMGTAQTDIGRMGSSVVALGNSMATTEADILGFAQNIAGAGAIAGLTEAQVFGIGAAFSSVGIQAEAGGTATQKVLLGINQAVMEGGENLETFAATAGLSAEDFGAAWEEDAGAVFTSFVEGLGDAGDDAVGILSDLGLEDQRLIKSFLSLAGAGDLLNESMGISQDAWRENTALTKEAAQRYATTESQIQLFKNTLRDVGLTIGDMVLPVLRDMLAAMNPLVEGFGALVAGDIDVFFDGLQLAISGVAQALGVGEEDANAFAEAAMNMIAQIIVFKDAVVEFLQPVTDAIAEFVNWKDVLIVLAGALLVVVVPAIWAILSPILPVIAAIAAAIAVVALLRNAWEMDWGSIRTNLTAFWGETGQPIFEQLKTWLGVAIPAAIAVVSDYWTNTLQPALAMVWAFINDSIFPIFVTLWDWLGVAIPAAVETVSAFWTDVLHPALETVWEFVDGSVIPLWEALAEFFNVAMTLALTALAGLWQNILQPALEAIWDFIEVYLLPIFESLVAYFVDTFGPQIATAEEWLADLKAAFSAISTAISSVIGWIKTLTDKLSGLDLPDWLTPGSPTPFELGLLGIADALALVSGTELPKLEMGLRMPNMSGGAGVTMLPDFAPANISTRNSTRTTKFEIGGTFIGPETPADLGEFVRMQEMLSR